MARYVQFSGTYAVCTSFLHHSSNQRSAAEQLSTIITNNFAVFQQAYNLQCTRNFFGSSLAGKLVVYMLFLSDSYVVLLWVRILRVLITRCWIISCFLCQEILYLPCSQLRPLETIDLRKVNYVVFDKNLFWKRKCIIQTWKVNTLVFKPILSIENIFQIIKLLTMFFHIYTQ